MKHKIFGLFLLLFFLTTDSNSQQLFTKCMSGCLPGSMGSRGYTLGQLIFEPTNNIYKGGSSWNNYTGYYISKTDSLNNLIWSQKFAWSVYDTVVGIPDSIYRLNNVLSNIYSFYNNSIGFTIVQDSLIYTRLNNVMSFNRYGISSTILNRIDLSGNLMWSRIVNCEKNNQLNYSASTSERSLFAGNTSIGYPQNSQNGNQLLVCTDSSGVYLWSKYFTGTAGKLINNVCNYFDQGFLVLSNDSINCYLTKMDINGNLEWSNSFVDGLSLLGIDLMVASDSSIFVLANLNSTAYKSTILKIDASGQLIWARNYGTTNIQIPTQFVDVSEDTLKTLIHDGNGSSGNIVMLKTDLNGNIASSIAFYQYSNSYGNIPTANTYSLLRSLNKQGSFYIGTVNGEINIPAVGMHFESVKTIRFDSELNTCQYNRFNTTMTSGSLNISINSFVITDSTLSVSLSPYQLDLLPQTFTITDECISSVGIPENTFFDEFVEIFPNPSSGVFSLNIKQPISEFEMSVFDDKGSQIIQNNKINIYGNQEIILPPNLSNGIYSIRFVMDGHCFYKKIAVIKR